MPTEATDILGRPKNDMSAARAGKARYNNQTRFKMAAKVMALMEPPPKGPGMTTAEVAKRTGYSVRHVFNLKRIAKEMNLDGTALVYIPEVPTEERLSDAARSEVHAGREWLVWIRENPGLVPPEEVIEAAAVAFERFYIHYSGLYFPAHWRDWVRAALGNIRLLLNVPPGHAKSELFSVWLPMWFVALDRNIRILIVSETVTLAKKFAKKIAWFLEWHAPLVAEHGRFRPDNEAAPWRPLSGELLVHGRDRQAESADLTLQIRGSGQQILGMRADIIIGDDVVGRDSASSDLTRGKLSEYWHGDVMSRLSPVSRVWVIGQRIHFLDLYGELSEAVDTNTGKRRWHHISMPAVIREPSLSPDGSTLEAEVLWPEEWPYARLMEAKADVTRRDGSQLWETMYQQNPLPSKGVTVQREWVFGGPGFRGCLDLDRVAGSPATMQRLLGVGDDMEIPEEMLRRTNLVRVMTLDPPQARAGGLIIEDIVEDREVFTSGVIEIHRLEPGIQKVHTLVREKAGYYSPDYLIVEKNGAQRWFKEDPGFVAWHYRSNVRLLEHATGVSKESTQWGLESLSADFEMGRIRLPYGDADSRAMSNLLIDEVTRHPYGDYDDLFMALWFAKFNLPKLHSTKHYNGRNPKDEPSRFGSPPRVRRGWRRQQAVAS